MALHRVRRMLPSPFAGWRALLFTACVVLSLACAPVAASEAAAFPELRSVVAVPAVVAAPAEVSNARFEPSEAATPGSSVQPEGTSLAPSVAAKRARVNTEPRWGVPIWHHMVLMTGMRSVETWLWPDPFAEARWWVIAERYEAAFTQPPVWDSQADVFEWDGDPWGINVVGHSAFGSELYLAARRCGFGPLGSSGFTVAGSTAWEYGFEASGVRPSGLDLWFTPLSGALIGEARFWLLGASEAIENPVVRGIAQSAVDPFGQLMRALGAEC